MNIAPIFGILGTLIGLIRALPQLIRLLVSGEARGVSVDTSATSSLISVGWIIYGILTGQLIVVVASVPSALIFAFVVIFALRFGRQAREIRFAPVWLTVLILAITFGGKQGLGLVLPVSILVANIPQIRVALNESNLSELSLGTWFLSFSDGLTWLIFALLKSDWPILASACLQMITSGTIVTIKLIRRWKAEHQPGDI